MGSRDSGSGWLIADPSTVTAATNLSDSPTVSNSPLCETLGLQVMQRREAFLERYRALTHAGLDLLKAWLRQHPSLGSWSPRERPSLT